MILIIAALIVASGFFSLFDQALKAVRKPRLHKEADNAALQMTGRVPGAHRRKVTSSRRILQAAEDPDRYFAAASFWIIGSRTCAAVLTGLSIGRFTQTHAQAPIIPVIAAAAGFIVTVLLLGDLLPRIIARRAPEPIATALLPLFALCALPLRPFYFLTRAAARQLQAIFPPKSEQQGMTEDELRHALIEGEKSGIVESTERTMVEGVFYLGDRPLGTFMIHRSDVQWLDINAPPGDIRAKVVEYRNQRCFPVADGTLDSIAGAAYREDILLDLASPSPAGLRTVMQKAIFAPETMPALKAFESFKRGKADFLFVMDEYGGFAGMVSIHHLMEEIVGELTAPVRQEPEPLMQADGSILASGSINIDDAAKLLSLPELSAANGDYHTLAGFVLSLAGELPRAGDSFSYQGYRFTVREMDGNRIDKIAVQKDDNRHYSSGDGVPMLP